METGQLPSRYVADAEFLTNEEDKQLMPKIYVDDVLNHAKRYL
jgi:hypothetical protein